MVRVIVGTTTQKSEKNYPGDTTIRHILEDNAIDYSTSTVRHIKLDDFLLMEEL